MGSWGLQGRGELQWSQWAISEVSGVQVQSGPLANHKEPGLWQVRLTSEETFERNRNQEMVPVRTPRLSAQTEKS